MPKCLACIVIWCFQRRYPKQNSVIRLKSNKILGWLRYCLGVLSVATHGFIGCCGVKVYAGEVKLGLTPPDLPSFASPFRASLFRINDFYLYDLMPRLKISAHATEWGPVKVLSIGPRNC